MDHRRHSTTSALSLAEDGRTLIRVHPSTGPGLVPEAELEFMDCPDCGGLAFTYHDEGCPTCRGRGFI